MERVVTFPSVGETCIGTLHDTGDLREPVIVLHGWGGTRTGPQRILLALSRALAVEGRSSLRFDVRGRGDSTGEAASVTVDTMADDCLAAADWLRSEYGAERFQLVGICSGGNIALAAASVMPDLVSRVVAWSLLPFMEQRAGGASRRGRLARLGEYARKAVAPSTWRRLLKGEVDIRGAGRAALAAPEGSEDERRRKHFSRDVLADLAAYRGRLDLVYGDRDPEYPGSRETYERWCTEKEIGHSVTVVAGANHNFYRLAWTREVIARTVEMICSI